MSHRLHMVNENVHRELSLVLAEQGPSEEGLVTITHVLTTPDLREATVWVSVLNSTQPEKIVDQLNANSNHYYEILSPRMKMKYVPKLLFKLDEQGDELSRIDALLDQI